MGKISRRNSLFIAGFTQVAIATFVALLVRAGVTHELSDPTKSERNEYEVTPSPEVGESYLPATYGLPETIAGYETLAVLTPTDVACMRSNVRRIVLRASETSAEAFLANSRGGEIRQDLSQIITDPPVEWQVEIVGPNVTREQVVSGYDQWNATFRDSPCIKLGPIPLMLTVTPRAE